jgi:hypothetical protein
VIVLGYRQCKRELLVRVTNNCFFSSRDDVFFGRIEKDSNLEEHETIVRDKF